MGFILILTLILFSILSIPADSPLVISDPEGLWVTSERLVFRAASKLSAVFKGEGAKKKTTKNRARETEWERVAGGCKLSWDCNPWWLNFLPQHSHSHTILIFGILLLKYGYFKSGLTSF